MRTSIRIIGTGAALPARATTREELDERLRLPPGTLAAHGAARQRWLSTDETAAALAARACTQALDASGLRWSDIDLLVAANATTDQGLPYNASLVHAELGLQDHPIASFDIGASCLSFLHALDVVGHLLHNGRYRHVMLVSADIATFGLNWQELRECGNFGDGAAAAVLRRAAPDEASCIRASSFRTLSQGVHYCEIPAGGSRFHPARLKEDFDPLTRFSMDGKAVYRLVAGVMEGFCGQLLRDSGRTLNDLAAVVPHQASRLAIDHLRARLRVPADKVVDVFDELANQVGASLPSALHRAVSTHRVRRGDDVLLIGSGAGVSLGGMVLTY